MDYPDPDVIRVGDTYYMISTTMHYNPGAVILRSFDLVHWEIYTYVYNTPEDTPARRLDGGSVYGKGMWAASLRYHNERFYVCFVANDTGKTYLYTTDDLLGTWQMQTIEGFFHDCSLLFDNDRVFIAYGNTEIHLTELERDLSKPKKGGLDRVIVTEKDNVILGYEGTHLYKINGRYYAFFIHWKADGSRRRVQACFSSDSLEGEFTGGNVLDDDMGYRNAGVAQGGIVDTPEGDFFAVLFQDYGAVGRLPVLVPVRFEGSDVIFGENGRVPDGITVKSTRPDHQYAPLYSSDDFTSEALSNVWQWNHIPDMTLVSTSERKGALRIKTGKLCENIEQAANILTQRTLAPFCSAKTTLDTSALNDGDTAGLAAFQGCYGFIAVKKEQGSRFLVMSAREALPPDFSPDAKTEEREYVRVPLPPDETVFTLRVDFHFCGDEDFAEFYYKKNDEWQQLGCRHKLVFKLDHFTGCRIGLFVFSSLRAGGFADFMNFIYSDK